MSVVGRVNAKHVVYCEINGKNEANQTNDSWVKCEGSKTEIASS